MYKTISWLAVLIWMVLIFQLSSQVAHESNQLSTGITEVILKFIERIIPHVELDMSSFNHIVRKNAHFFAYLILGLLLINALKRSSVEGYKGIFLAITISVLYAASDEAHQLFVPGRGGQIKDVIIDSLGAGVGVMLERAMGTVRSSRSVAKGR